MLAYLRYVPLFIFLDDIFSYGFSTPLKVMEVVITCWKDILNLGQIIYTISLFVGLLHYIDFEIVHRPEVFYVMLMA